MKIYFLASLFLISLTSCVNLKPADFNKEKIQLSAEELSKLNGSYSIYSLDNSITLPRCLVYNFTFNQNNLPNEGDRVNLEISSKNRINVTIYDDNSIVKKKKLKGTIRNGYFESSSCYLDPFYFLIYAVTKQKTRIGLLTNGNLIIDSGRSTRGFMFFFMPFAGADDYDQNKEFKRLHSNQ